MKKTKEKLVPNNQKKLSPQQRIKRLQNKIASKHLITSQNVSMNSNVDVTDAAKLKHSAIQTGLNLTGKQCTSTSPNIIGTYDEFFVEDDGRVVPIDEHGDLKMNGTINLQPISSGSVDLTFDKTNTIVNKRDNSNDNVQNSISSVQQIEPLDIRSMIVSLMAKCDYMNGEVLALRRQVARIEAKSTAIRHLNNPHTTFELNENAFLDFESTLMAEGLPIKSIQNVCALEQRLKETAFSSMPYRQKLV